MKSFSSFLIVAAALSALPTAQGLQAQSGQTLTTRAPNFVEVPDELEFNGIMTARPLQAGDAEDYGISARELRTRAANAVVQLDSYEILKYVGATDEYLIQVPEGSDENAVAAALMSSGNFQYVEPDWTIYPIGCPDDSNFGNQWHHNANRLDSCAGWDLHTGNPTTVVAICDTGLRTTHVDFQQHRQEGFNSADGVWESAGGQINDINGHGTMTSGCAAANGDNGIGIAGIGWNLGHRMMRVTNASSGSAQLSALTLAVRTAVDAGDKVASVSYSGVQSASVETAGAYARANGALLVYAAGNSSALMTGNRDDSIIVVGATTSSDASSSFSNYGPFVDMVAPGSSVYTTTANGDNTYGSVSGTSFSCPLTAGLCALIFSLNPSMTPEQVEQVLRDGCDDLGSPGLDDTFGYGRINVHDSLDLAATPLLISFPNGRPNMVDPAGGSTVQIAVADGIDTLVPGSGAFFLDRGNGFEQTPLVEVSAGLFEATFPAGPCGPTLDYYFAFLAASAGVISSPEDAPADSYSTVATTVAELLSDDIEAPSGWTAGVAGDDATTGIWTRVDPLGTAAQPEDDHTAAGTDCFVTGQGTGGSLGENDVDSGSTTLLSPIYDMSAIGEPIVSYWRWYSNDTEFATGADIFVIDISNDGGSTWSNVEVIGPTGAGTGGGWIEHSFTVSSILAATDQMQLRFIASDLDSGSIIEAGIDDFSISELACPDCWSYSYCPATANSSGAVGRLSASGSLVVADNSFTLDASDVPAGQNGLFFYGANQIELPFGNGMRCVGGTLYRLPVLTTTGGGTLSYTPDLTSPPSGGMIGAGTTWNFQLWFRDPAAGGANFNTTEGLSATFCP